MFHTNSITFALLYLLPPFSEPKKHPSGTISLLVRTFHLPRCFVSCKRMHCPFDAMKQKYKRFCAIYSLSQFVSLRQFLHHKLNESVQGRCPRNARPDRREPAIRPLYPKDFDLRTVSSTLTFQLLLIFGSTFFNENLGERTAS